MQALENQEGRALLAPTIGYSIRVVPDVGRTRILERVLPGARTHVVIGAGEPLAFVESAQHGVARAFVVAGALTLALALLASYIAGARVSAPLRRMAGLAARVDAGDLAPRMETGPGRGERSRCSRTPSTTCSTGSRRRSRPARVRRRRLA